MSTHDGSVVIPMDDLNWKILKPKRLEIVPATPGATSIFKHWLVTLKGYVDSIPACNKLLTLVNSISHENYEIISTCTTYEDAIAKLEATYVKPPSDIISQQLKQEPGEKIADYVRKLEALSVHCNFKDVTANVYRKECVRDSLISGLASSAIRTRLLENKTLTLEEAINQAQALEVAAEDAGVFSGVHQGGVPGPTQKLSDPVSLSAVKQKCFFCGYERHARTSCPARASTCRKCNGQGHWAVVCRKAGTSGLKSVTQGAEAKATTVAATHNPSNAMVNAQVDGKSAQALVDSGSAENFLDEDFARLHSINMFPYFGSASMASGNYVCNIKHYAVIDVMIKRTLYKGVRVLILKNLVATLILGEPFAKLHSQVVISYGGPKPPLIVCSISAMKIPPPRVFSHLAPNCHPIITKTRRYSPEDIKFIEEEIRKLLALGIIERSDTPWRAQVVVTKGQNSKRRLCIDFSSTINRFTYLDGFPLPNMEDMANNLANYSFFSVLDLKSAYHQVPLHTDDQIYTGFEANGSLYHFKRLCFGLTNAVAAFQRVMTDLIKSNNLQGVHAYLDDVIIGGATEADHDRNLERFLEVVRKFHLTLNKDKCLFKKMVICALGYEISHRTLKPDPTRLGPIKNMRPPENKQDLMRINGLFAYYSRWIQNFSDKIRPLVKAELPLCSEGIHALEVLKNNIIHAVRTSIDENSPFCVETDTSDFCISGILSQNNRPVAFFSRTLNPSERQHHSVEKEAYAIVESIRSWHHYLANRHFTLITDQRSVSYMFNMQTKNKIKNEKILRWRLELMPYSYTIQHRPGKQNIPADTLSRVNCSSSQIGTKAELIKLHSSLCHPGIARMAHFVRDKKLPYSIEDIRRITASCRTCATWKPRFFKPSETPLIKALQPFDRLSIDFKGPLPTTKSGNKYLLVAVDEYSRYPFAFPCKDMNSSTVIRCLSQIFSLFGTVGYIHADNALSFNSSEMKEFLSSRGIALSHSTIYHPTGNAQCERYVGIVWRTICLTLHSNQLQNNAWDLVLDSVLHSIRSLLSTSTGETPHDRLFSFKRRSTSGLSFPDWLLCPGPILFKKHVRRKDESPVEEVLLVEPANSKFAHIKFSNGREARVSTSDLAPLPEGSEIQLNRTVETSVPNIDNIAVEQEVHHPNAPQMIRPPIIHQILFQKGGREFMMLKNIQIVWKITAPVKPSE